MITRLSHSQQVQDLKWQSVMRQSIRKPEVMIKELGLDQAMLLPARQASKNFALCVPDPFYQRIQAGNPKDPLLRQVWPLIDELAPQPDHYSCDPTGDLKANPCPGILHKYHRRALVIATGQCAIHCRYCFRRHFPYQQSCAHLSYRQTIIDYLRQTPDLEEVILSGGDPLMLPDGSLLTLVKALAEISHLQRLRIHTRMPVVLPQRINAALLHCLCSTRLTPLLVLHINHSQEIGEAGSLAIERLYAAGVRMYNQSVLLHGVNDEVSVLERLSQELFQHRIEPYYLHLLDKVQGSAHFAVQESKAIALLKDLSVRLPGYMVPRLVKEVAGQLHKVVVGQDT